MRGTMEQGRGRRIWADSVVCTVCEPSRHPDPIGPMRYGADLASEQRIDEEMKNVERQFSRLCRKHIGKPAPRQAFARWLMERSLYQPEGAVIPRVSSHDEISPCMYRELVSSLFTVPGKESTFADYKAYLQAIEEELGKRSEKILALSSWEMKALHNTLPATIKLINLSLSMDSTSKSTAALAVPDDMHRESLEQALESLNPIVEKVVLADVATICKEMSAYTQKAYNEVHGSLLFSMPDESNSLAPITTAGVVTSGLVGACCSASRPANGTGHPVAGNGLSLSRPGADCRRRMVAAGRGWAKGNRAQERRDLIAKLNAARLQENSVLRRQADDRRSDMVTLSSSDGVKCSIACAHYQKLRHLYASNCSKLDPELLHFPQRLLCLLKRYETLLGDMSAVNLQGALPLPAFHYLHQEFGVTMESFASPLNCYFPQYCSLYGDTDRAFGSRGSFYKFSPVEGSLAANPPFCEEVIERMADHIDHLLAATDRPLSFCVFIPEWRKPPTPGAVKMDASRFLQSHSVLSARHHTYRTGKQHLVTDTGRASFVASFGTEVFFLQNTAGKAKWPATPERLAALHQAFDSR